MSHAQPQEQFLRAVAEDDDERVENVVLRLTPVDEAWLLDLTLSDDMDQRWWSVRALAICGTNACVPRLIEMLNDSDAGVRAATLLALAHIAERLPAELLDEALVAMAGCLADEEGFVRQAATDALALCGDAAVDVLAGVLSGDHQGARTRATASLRKIGSMKAAVVLYQHLNDPNYLVRLYAYEALDEMGLLENQLLIL